MKTALLIIDTQKAMFMEDDLVYQADELVKTINKLLYYARTNKYKVIYIQHCGEKGHHLEHGTELWEIHNELTPRPDDTVIQKKVPDSFYETELEKVLNKSDIKHLILAGIQTEICIDTTCRSARSKNYQVTLASDAHSTWGSSDLTAAQIVAHHNKALKWFANVKPTVEICAPYK